MLAEFLPMVVRGSRLDEVSEVLVHRNVACAGVDHGIPYGRNTANTADIDKACLRYGVEDGGSGAHYARSIAGRRDMCAFVAEDVSQ